MTSRLFPPPKKKITRPKNMGSRKLAVKFLEGEKMSGVIFFFKPQILKNFWRFSVGTEVWRTARPRGAFLESLEIFFCGWEMDDEVLKKPDETWDMYIYIYTWYKYRTVYSMLFYSNSNSNSNSNSILFYSATLYDSWYCLLYCIRIMTIRIKYDFHLYYIWILIVYCLYL